MSEPLALDELLALKPGQKSPLQRLADEVLTSSALNQLFAGGSRSGKSFHVLRAIVMRASKKTSKHAIWRQRFNHIKSSIVYDTLPKVMRLCFPELEPHCVLNKSDWVYRIPAADGGISEIWFGGLDSKERSEKVLGNEYSSIFFEECSQMLYASVEMGLTRLAENSGLKLRAYFACNPPKKSHWTYKVFVKGVHPDTGDKFAPGQHNWLQMNPVDENGNLLNPFLPKEYIEFLQSLGPAQRKRFLKGEWGDATEGALWDMKMLEKARIFEEDAPDMGKIVVAIDPAVSSNPGSNETGIVVCGKGLVDRRGYIIEDCTMKGKPSEWAQAAVDAYYAHEATEIIAEVNQGGDLVEAAIAAIDSNIPYTAVRATRGKFKRASPVATLYSKDKVRHVGGFPALEDQMLEMTDEFDIMEAGYSPDRLDAAVWGLTHLMIGDYQEVSTFEVEGI